MKIWNKTNHPTDVIAGIIREAIHDNSKAAHYGQLCHCGFVVFATETKAEVFFCKRHNLSSAEKQMKALGFEFVPFELD